MHTTPRKMCPRHQKYVIRIHFQRMKSFFGFGTRRLFNVGCFINIFGAKTTQKHCSFWQLTLRRDQATNIIISTSFSHSEKTLTRQGTKKRRHLDHIPWDSPTSSKFPAENTQKQYYLDYTLWNSLSSSTCHHRRKPSLVYIGTPENLQSTQVFYHPPLSTFGKQQHSLFTQLRPGASADFLHV